MSVSHITSSEFKTEVLEAAKPVLVDFFAEWCGPCQMMAPVLEELSEQYPQISVVKIDSDEAANLAMTYQIDSIPAFLLFENGRPVKRVIGAMPLDALAMRLGLSSLDIS